MIRPLYSPANLILYGFLVSGSGLEVSRSTQYLDLASILRCLSSLVGVGVMILCLPLPGFIASKLQTSQIQRMKMVRLLGHLTARFSPLTFCPDRR